MDTELRREIIRRIGERKRELDDARTTRAHVEAIAEVLDVDICEVEAILEELTDARSRTRGPGAQERASGLRFALVACLLTAALLGALAATLLGRSEPHAVAPAPIVAVTSADTRPYVQASIVADILASIAPVRMLVTEHHMSEGAFPARLEDIGLSRADVRTGRHIEDLVLGDDGAILVKAVEALAPQAYVVVSPRLTMGGLNLEWHCVVNVAIAPPTPCEYGALASVTSRF